MKRVDELERFKVEISLAEFAQSLGYVVVQKESSRASTVMQRGGDKIVVATDQSSGHGIFFNVNDERDGGTVIDFAQRRLGQTLGHIRKELRGWVSVPSRPSPRRRPSHERPAMPAPVERDRAALLAAWAASDVYTGDYLTLVRGLSLDLVAAWNVRQDARGNAIFPHFDANGVCGWESKNRAFTGFSKGGNRGLGLARLEDKPVQRIVIAEASIDVASWAQLHGRPEGTLYCSLGGTMGQAQIELMKHALQMTNTTAALVIATDRDSAGEKAAERIALAFPEARIERSRPESPCKDWNDALLSTVAQVAVREMGVAISKSV